MKIKLLNEFATVPTRGTVGSAGIDLYASDDVLIIPGFSEVVPTGIAAAIPEGQVGLLTHRSSLAFKMECVASLGVIDSDYRGEIKVKIFNHGGEGLYIKKGDKFAQMVVVPYYSGDLEVVDDLDDTDRGAGGFGSTGQ